MPDCGSRRRDGARICTRPGCGHPQRKHERDESLHYTGACNFPGCDCHAMSGADAGTNKVRRNF